MRSSRLAVVTVWTLAAFVGGCATLETRKYVGTDVGAAAVEALRGSAQRGDAEAQCWLASSFFHGLHGPQDYSKAAKWYRAAAEQGHAEAQVGLGECYHKGLGVAHNNAAAVTWYRKAGEQGHVRALRMVGHCYAGRCPHGKAGLEPDDHETVAWYRKAVELGSAEAQFDLAECYRHGRGVAQDAVQMVAWYRRAAEQGLAMAQCNLGACYFRGDGIRQDLAEAMKWYRRAADQGSSLAQSCMGDIYYVGIGVSKDLSEAAKWYRRAAAQGFADAQFNLANFYARGIGVPQDRVEAYAWAGLAARIKPKAKALASKLLRAMDVEEQAHARSRAAALEEMVGRSHDDPARNGSERTSDAGLHTVVVNKARGELALLILGVPVKRFRVSIGEGSPTGEYTVAAKFSVALTGVAQSRSIDLAAKGEPVEPGKFAIYGGWDGKARTSELIQMRDRDLQEIFDAVRLRARVEIRE
jgi:TPR repeat protein